MKVCFYLSDHGFGHISRNLSIIEAVLKRNVTKVFVVCNESHIEFAKQNLSTMVSEEDYKKIEFRVEKMDIGLILKPGTLLVDPDVLIPSCEEYLAGKDERAAKEAEWLKENGVDKVLCDMPIWGFDACEKAGIPYFYIGNFTWCEMYREHLPERIWKAYAAEFAKVKKAVLYALHNPEMLEFLPNADITEVSVVARPFHQDFIDEIRAKHNRRIIFVALGMSAQFEKPVDVSDIDADFYTTEGVPLEGANVTKLTYKTKYTHDYVAAADFVIAKAGWSTIAECLLAKKRMALFARDTVLEDRTSIKFLEARCLATKIEEEELYNLSAVIERLENLSDEGFNEFYHSKEEIADILVNLE